MTNLQKQSGMMVARAWEVEKWDDVDQSVQTFNYKMNKF